MPKLKQGFTLFEILIVVTIVGIIYSLVFLPLATKFKDKTADDSGILSISKQYAKADEELKFSHEPLVLKCGKDYKECGFYKILGELVGKSFALSVKSPSEIFRLKPDGSFYTIWKNDAKEGFSFLCPNGLPELFIVDGEVYKIGAMAQNNFKANSKEEALSKSLQFLPLKANVVEE